MKAIKMVCITTIMTLNQTILHPAVTPHLLRGDSQKRNADSVLDVHSKKLSLNIN
jgi:hypothetical protein